MNDIVNERQKLVLIGNLSAPHGIKGDMIINSYAQDPESLFNYKLYTQDNQEIKIKKIKNLKNKNFLCKLDGILDRTSAEKLKNTKIYAARSEFPDIEHDEFYQIDLIGMEVLDKSNNKLGEVVQIYNFGAGDLVEIKFSEGNKELYPIDKNFIEITDKYIILQSNFLK